MRMTLLEVLKQIFGDKLDSEIEKADDTKKDEGTGKDTSGGEEGKDNKDDKADEKEDETMVVLENGWYDEKTGKIDVTKVKDEHVLEALNMLNNKITSTKEQSMVSNAINEAVSKLQLSISADMFKKLIDTSAIKVKDGSVVGLTEAIDAIKTAEPGIFKGETKKAENNPLNQGFDPVTKTSDSPGNWAEAFAMQEATSN